MTDNIAWRAAARCGNATCVEVGPSDDLILVRDTKDKGEGPILSYTKDEWSAFIAGVKDGQFDLDKMF